jgi:drug/metabolite transporter (DMT)-like permease
MGGSFPVIVHSIQAYGAGSVLTSVYGGAAFVTLMLVACRQGISSILSGSLSVELFTRGVLFLGQVVPLYVALEIVDRAFLGGVFLCFFLWPVLALFYIKWLTEVRVARELALFVGASLMFVALAVEFFEQGLLGVAMSQNVVAYGLALVAANSCALYAAVTRRYGCQGQGDVMTPVVCLAAAVGGVVISMGSSDGHIFFFSWPLVLIGGATGLAQLLWDTSVRRGNGFVASALACLTPWIAIFSAGTLTGVFLVEHLQECALLLVLALLSMAFVVMVPRSVGVDN